MSNQSEPVPTLAEQIRALACDKPWAVVPLNEARASGHRAAIHAAAHLAEQREQELLRKVEGLEGERNSYRTASSYWWAAFRYSEHKTHGAVAPKPNSSDPSQDAECRAMLEREKENAALTSRIVELERERDEARSERDSANLQIETFRPQAESLIHFKCQFPNEYPSARKALDLAMELDRKRIDLESRLDFLKSRGLTVTKMTDQQGERWVYVIEEGSELCDKATLDKLLELERERDEAHTTLDSAGIAREYGYDCSPPKAHAAEDLMTLSERVDALGESLKKVRVERNIMLKWLRTVDAIDTLLGCQHDSSPEYTLKVWTEKIQDLRAQLAAAEQAKGSMVCTSECRNRIDYRCPICLSNDKLAALTKLLGEVRETLRRPKFGTMEAVQARYALLARIDAMTKGEERG